MNKVGDCAHQTQRTKKKNKMYEERKLMASHDLYDNIILRRGNENVKNSAFLEQVFAIFKLVFFSPELKMLVRKIFDIHLDMSHGKTCFKHLLVQPLSG